MGRNNYYGGRVYPNILLAIEAELQAFIRHI